MTSRWMLCAATPSDAAAVARLVNEHWRQLTGEDQTTEERVRTWMTKPETDLGRDGPRSRRFGRLRGGRSRGLGAALLAHALHEFYERGCASVEVLVDSENLTGAVRLYEHAGMRTIRTQMVYEGAAPGHGPLRALAGTTRGSSVPTGEKPSDDTKLSGLVPRASTGRPNGTDRTVCRSLRTRGSASGSHGRSRRRLPAGGRFHVSVFPSTLLGCAHPPSDTVAEGRLASVAHRQIRIRSRDPGSPH